jgi:hypothetical protein
LLFLLYALCALNSIAVRKTKKLSGDDDEEEEKPRPKVTTRQYFILSVLLIATLSSSFAVCLFPPFFPREDN